MHAKHGPVGSSSAHELTHDHPEGIRMPHAKFCADRLETVTVHKEQRSMQYLSSGQDSDCSQITLACLAF